MINLLGTYAPGMMYYGPLIDSDGVCSGIHLLR